MAVNIKGKPLYWSTGIDNTGLKQGSTKATGILRGLKGQVSKMDVFAGLSISAGIAFAKMSKHAFAFSKDFQHAMFEVMTISDAVKADYDGMAQKVIDIGASVPETATGIARGLYQIVSAGYDGARALDILAVSAKGAVAAVSDTFTVADVLTSVMNAYGDAAGNAMEISDKLFTVVENGKTTMAELAPQIGVVTGLAAQAGLKFTDLAAAFALGTKTLKTDIFTTGIKGFMTAIIGPGDDAIQVASDLGIEFSLLSLQTKGLGGFINDLMEKTNGSVEALAKLFPNVRGLTGVLALGAQGGKLFAEQLDNMNKSAGATNDAFDIMIKTVQNQIAVLRNNIDVALKPLGDAILGKVGDLVTKINVMFESGEMEQYIDALKLFARVVILLTKAFVSYKAAVIAATLISKAYVIAQGIAKTVTLVITGLTNRYTRALTVAVVAQKAMNTAAKANPYAAVITLIVTLGSAMALFAKKTDDATEAKKAFDKQMEVKKDLETSVELIGRQVKLGGLLTKSEMEALKETTQEQLVKIRKLEVEALTAMKENKTKLWAEFNKTIDKNSPFYGPKAAAIERQIENSNLALIQEITGFTNDELQELKERLFNYNAYLVEKTKLIKREGGGAVTTRGTKITKLKSKTPTGTLEVSKAYRLKLLADFRTIQEKMKAIEGRYFEIRIAAVKTYTGAQLVEVLTMIETQRLAERKAIMDAAADYEWLKGEYASMAKDITILGFKQLVQRKSFLEDELKAAKLTTAQRKILLEDLAKTEDALNDKRIENMNQTLYVMGAVRDLLVETLGLERETAEALTGMGRMIESVVSGDILGAAVQLGKLVVNAFIGDSTIVREVTDEMRESLAGVNHELAMQQILMKNISGDDLISARENEIRLIEKKIKIIEELRRVEEYASKGYLYGLIKIDTTDPDKIREYEQQLANLFATLDDIQNTAMQSVTQTTAQGIADGIARGFAEGKGAAQVFGDTFEDLMKNALRESFKQSILEKGISEFYASFAAMSESGGELTGAEIDQLRDEYKQALENSALALRNLEAVSGIDLGEGTAGAGQMATAIKGITENTANLLAGQFNGMRVNIQRQSDILLRSLDILTDIADNTSYNHLLAEINEKLGRTEINDALRGIGV